MHGRAVTGLEAFRRDRARYRRSAWVTQRALWAVGIHRLGEAVAAQPWPVRRVLDPLHALLTLAVQCLTGIELGRGARIGPGLLVMHGAGLVVHGQAVLGEDCVLLQGVTVGNRRPAGPAPVIGDRVVLNAYAQVLGEVRVGDDVAVGALSLVIHDVPSGSVVVGAPARPVGLTSSKSGT